MVYLLKAKYLTGHLGLYVSKPHNWSGWAGGEFATSVAYQRINDGMAITADVAPRAAERGLEGPYADNIPHVFELAADQYVVSEAVRVLLDRYAPKQCNFFPFQINTEIAHSSPRTFFYMDVAARAQRIDWKASKKEFSKYQQRPDGKKFIFVDSNDRFDGYVFKCDPTAEIKIWRENDVEDDNYIWSTSKGNIFVSDDLGARLKREFPGCLALLQIKEMQA